MSMKTGAPEGALAAKWQVEQVVRPQHLRILSHVSRDSNHLYGLRRPPSAGWLPVSWNMPSVRMHCAYPVERLPVQADGVTKLSNPRSESSR